jgi:hypothetical protein
MLLNIDHWPEMGIGEVSVRNIRVKRTSLRNNSRYWTASL